MKNGKKRDEKSYEAKKMRGINNSPMPRHILRTDEQDDAGGNPSAQTEKITKKFSKVKTNEADIPIK